MSFKQYGGAKLKKPEKLRGIKQEFSIYYGRKSKCQVFIKDNDVWVKHGDYFSPMLQVDDEYMGMPLSEICKIYLGKDRRKKFVYNDAWGAIVLRNEAWIKLEGLMLDIKKKVFPLDIVADILRQQEEYHGMTELSLCCTEMERFWESVINRIYKCKRVEEM